MIGRPASRDRAAVEVLLNPEVWIAFLTLTALEIVLGIDNIVFISILTSRLPREQQRRGRIVGLSLAMVLRIGLLLSLTWLMGLTVDLFRVLGQGISGRDVILLSGGAFLIAKSTMEVHNSLEHGRLQGATGKSAGFFAIMVQIALVDMVFSLDSVITAVGLVQRLPVMVAAIVVAVGVMMWSVGPISRFVEDHPTVKMLALSFLMLIGLALVGEGLDLHIPKGYIYFAMAFSFGVEMLNLRVRRLRAPIRLRKAQFADLYLQDEGT
jgi:predicted tellurium resistance membrane protein TerC